MLLKQMRAVMPGEIDTFKVQLIPLRAAPTAKIGSPEDVVRLVREMEDYDRESAKIIHLDTKNQVMGVETISIGSLSASIVHPRETVTGAILNKSANVIFVHNHPSGVCEPSQEDINISGKLKEAFELVGIVLLDSIIVGKGCHYSFREVGFITGKPYPATSGMVREPKASQETKDKVDFITTMTDYITAPDLERRKRAAEKIQAGKYFKPWFDEFFYEHDRESAKRKLMKFFMANEQGLGLVNHSYYGVLSDYLRAISKPVLMVRESAGANPCERIKEIKAEQQKLSKELADAYRAKDNTRVKKLVETGYLLRAEWDTLTRECQKEIYERAGGSAVRENTVPLVQHIKQEIKAIHALATKNDPSASPRADNAMKQIDSGVKAKTITQEQAKTLKEAVGRAFYKFPYIEIAKLLGEVEIKHEPGKIFPWRVVYAGTDKTVQTREYPEAMAYYTELEAERGIAGEGLTLLKKGRTPTTVSENIQTTNNTGALRNRELRKSFEKMWGLNTVNSIEAFLNRLTVDTSRYSRAVPIPESLVTGAAIAGDGFLFAYHVTDDPGGIMQKLKSNITLCQLNPEGDLGCGLYVSGVPEYWRVRSTMKWEFAKNLTRAQRQSLVTVILSDPNYKKGGGYLADFEVDYLDRDLKQFIETGDVNLLAGTGSQPYNVHITKEIARKAGVPEPKEPGFIKIKLQGKFINAAGLYSNQEVVNRAKAWAVINRPKLLEWNKRVSTQNVVNAWLCSMGYSGAFTKSGMSTNPEMAIWDRKAIIDARIPEPQT